MEEILRQSNLNLLREVERLTAALNGASVADELIPYSKWVLEACVELRKQVLVNLHDLNLGRDEIMVDILSRTQSLTRGLALCNEHYVSPILRALPSDRLCLRVLIWLHRTHQQVAPIPVAVSDGQFGIWPIHYRPTVYFMPSSAQRGLLFLPLFFHEFGHLLYVYHKQMMDDVVRGLQEEILELLLPVSQRNDLYSQAEKEGRSKIAESWYNWAQELFCDAVGLAIGGPSFTNAFSAYSRMRGLREFHLPRDELAVASHPVSWVRIKLLAERGHQMGWSSQMDRVEREWETIATGLSVAEDYFGFYSHRFLPAIQKAISTMMSKVSPYHASHTDVYSSEWEPARSTPVHLLNLAWSVLLSNPERYDAWEKQALDAFLSQ